VTHGNPFSSPIKARSPPFFFLSPPSHQLAAAATTTTAPCVISWRSPQNRGVQAFLTGVPDGRSSRALCCLRRVWRRLCRPDCKSGSDSFRPASANQLPSLPVLVLAPPAKRRRSRASTCKHFFFAGLRSKTVANRSAPPWPMWPILSGLGPPTRTSEYFFGLRFPGVSSRLTLLSARSPTTTSRRSSRLRRP